MYLIRWVSYLHSCVHLICIWYDGNANTMGITSFFVQPLESLCKPLTISVSSILSNGLVLVSHLLPSTTRIVSRRLILPFSIDIGHFISVFGSFVSPYFKNILMTSNTSYFICSFFLPESSHVLIRWGKVLVCIRCDEIRPWTANLVWNGRVHKSSPVLAASPSHGMFDPIQFTTSWLFVTFSLITQWWLVDRPYPHVLRPFRLLVNVESTLY